MRLASLWRFRSAEWSLGQASQPVTPADRRRPLIEDSGLGGNGGPGKAVHGPDLMAPKAGPTSRCRQPLKNEWLRLILLGGPAPVGGGEIGNCGFAGSPGGQALRGRRAARWLEGSGVRLASGQGRITTQIKLTPRAALLVAGDVACDVGCKWGLPLLAKLVYDGVVSHAGRHLWLFRFTWRSLFAALYCFVKCDICHYRIIATFVILIWYDSIFIRQRHTSN